MQLLPCMVLRVCLCASDVLPVTILSSKSGQINAFSCVAEARWVSVLNHSSSCHILGTAKCFTSQDFSSPNLWAAHKPKHTHTYMHTNTYSNCSTCPAHPNTCSKDTGKSDFCEACRHLILEIRMMWIWEKAVLWSHYKTWNKTHSQVPPPKLHILSHSIWTGMNSQ